MLDMLWQCVRDDKGDVCAAASLIFTKLCQPAITPGFGAFGFPKDHAGRRTYGAVDLLNDVGAQFDLGNGFDGGHRKLAAQDLLEFQLKNLALGLLRDLLGLAAELFDGTRHRLNGLVLLGDLQARGFIRFLLGFGADVVNRGLDTLFNRKIHFALFISQCALLAYQLGLSLLRLSQLGIVGFQVLAQLGGLSLLGLQMARNRFTGFLGLGRHQLAALGRQPLPDLLFLLFTPLAARVLLLAQGLGPSSYLGVLGGQLLVKALSRFLEEGSGQRFREFDFVVAVPAM